MLTTVVMMTQFFFTAVMGIYFLSLLRGQQSGKNALATESKKELEKLKKMGEVKLSVPLAEKTRPAELSEIVGQEDGIRALTAAVCGPNPQHVIIYGPPGVGKTAAARLILKKACKSELSPFLKNAKFIETDATTMRYDERSIADPLIGSVHDPIYQGAGAYGPAGVPQPKPGAVTKAHGGVLFIDEIGDLHPMQMNRLLKVLEDRRVFFESAYYASEDKNIPQHIHKIFKEGLPADFRLIGATTRQPEDIPPAIRSRCVEIYFKPLCTAHIETIAQNAAKRGGFLMEDGCAALVSQYADNGRDAVNIVQTAGSTSLVDGRTLITKKDIEWVLETGRYAKKLEKKVCDSGECGIVNGLSVASFSQGFVMDIEAAAVRAKKGAGSLRVTGIVEQEEIEGRGQKLTRVSTARGAVENVLTVMKNVTNIDPSEYHIHINFPGGIPVDGPSAGLAMFCAVYSAILHIPVSGLTAMTGEISILGRVKPVGGVAAKLEAARRAGIKRVIIPRENDQRMFEDLGLEVVKVDSIKQVLELCFQKEPHPAIPQPSPTVSVMTAEGAPPAK